MAIIHTTTIVRIPRATTRNKPVDEEEAPGVEVAEERAEEEVLDSGSDEEEGGFELVLGREEEEVRELLGREEEVE